MANSQFSVAIGSQLRLHLVSMNYICACFPLEFCLWHFVFVCILKVYVFVLTFVDSASLRIWPLCNGETFINSEWVSSNQILVFALRYLGSPQGKHCKLWDGNKWWTLCCHWFIRNGLRQCWYIGSVSFYLKNHKICYKTYQKTALRLV